MEKEKIDPSIRLTTAESKTEMKEILSHFNKTKKTPKSKIDNRVLIAIIIALALLLSAFILSYSYYKTNQYDITIEGTIIDKYNGTWIKPLKIID